QVVEYGPRLDAAAAALRVHLQDAVQVLRGVDHHRHVAALSGQAGAAATRQHGRAVPAADGHGLDDLVDRARDHYADRDLAVVGGVRGVEGAAAVVEAHLARDARAQVGFER